jgi:hypothetical protein
VHPGTGYLRHFGAVPSLLRWDTRVQQMMMDMDDHLRAGRVLPAWRPDQPENAATSSQAHTHAALDHGLSSHDVAALMMPSAAQTTTRTQKRSQPYQTLMPGYRVGGGEDYRRVDQPRAHVWDLGAGPTQEHSDGHRAEPCTGGDNALMVGLASAGRWRFVVVSVLAHYLLPFRARALSARLTAPW